MCGIQNVIRKQGTYYYSKIMRLGAGKPFPLRDVGRIGKSLTMNDKDLTLGGLDKATQEARRDDIAFAERAAVYSLVRTLAADVRHHIDDDMGGHGYAYE